MRITPIDTLATLKPNQAARVTEGSRGVEANQGSGVSFKETVKDAIREVNDLQGQADKSAIDLATGDLEDVHRAMIDMQQAKLALDLTIQVRNKIVEAYQEIMRMQM